MNPLLRGTWENIRELGLAALAHANRHAAYMSWENSRWSDLSVLRAAHAAELIIKARIAQEHPLLIFDQLPRSTQAEGSIMELTDLFRSGRTIQWNELPDRLWASTGLHIPQRAQFDSFGRLRNGIQHFGPSDGDPAQATLEFIFSVVDPFINQCWGLHAIDFDEDHVPYIYLVGTLVRRKILFLVSPAAAETFEEWDVDWDEVEQSYGKEILRRVNAAKAGEKSTE